MNKGKALVTALFALATLPLVAQQPTTAPPAAAQPASPATQQPTTAPPAAAPAQPSTPAPTAAPATAAIELSPVNGELVSKLDSKTAKTGDNVVVQTKASAKTVDGTEIPKGSKLMGHVIAVQASAEGKNSQVALQFDHIELKGGQSMPVHSQIQSITPAGGEAPTATSPASPGMAGNSANAAPSGASPSMSGANTTGRMSGGAPQAPPSEPGAAPSAGSGMPAAGTVVATSGQIAISTTAVPGVLLANNVAGQQDPRMAQASSILVGARKDIQLDGGTQIVVGVAAASGGTR